LKTVPEEYGGCGATVKGPSPSPWNENYSVPKEMTEAEIWEVIEAFGAAAARAVKAGIRIIAVHGAHGYLIHSFASPAVCVSPNVLFIYGFAIAHERYN
jgi:2,4-dienoyl-CoA reductase-like NADH-dependent reductase (Old Yellow Enzyme family)